MRGEYLQPIKVPRSAPESLKYAERFLTDFDKSFRDRLDRSTPQPREIKESHQL